MTARNEKPSPHESSTDTIIGALEIIAKILEGVTDIDGNQLMTLEVMTIIEAASRLDKLETELINCRDKALDDAANVCFMKTARPEFGIEFHDKMLLQAADEIRKLKESTK